ncbi:site-specific integrase [Streptomyces sp. NPDC007162]|uniref:site-specific integrase n=1 Tax=Streptomyces sp. NPDC007162 TaxID=3156917 RepID=UPI0033F1AF9E
MAIDRPIARRDAHRRVKTLWRMLYETVARAEEILGNIEELDVADRRASVKEKGARPPTRRRGAPRKEFVMEPQYWAPAPPACCPADQGRTCGPVFVTCRRPGPGTVVSPRGVCADSGPARLSYGQARAVLDRRPSAGCPGTGWGLHEWRHSGLTHLGEAGAGLPMLTVKSRHKKPENVRRYFHPLAEVNRRSHGLLAR